MVRAANSLNVALDQLNNIAPNRSKASDGWIASDAHSKANPSSWHEPDAYGIVRARDFTHDPANGADMAKYPMALIADPRALEVIFNDTFYDKDTNGQVRVRPYPTVNPKRTNRHDKHLHLSVVSSDIADQTHPWGAFINASTAPLPPPPVVFQPAGNPWDRIPTLEYGMRRHNVVLSLQQFMVHTFPAYNKYSPTGNYLELTAAGLAEFQRRVGITGPDANGRIVGPRTKAALWRAGWRG